MYNTGWVADVQIAVPAALYLLNEAGVNSCQRRSLQFDSFLKNVFAGRALCGKSPDAENATLHVRICQVS
jgi:hypothetical protein